MNAPFRPALRYLGGKWRLAPWIIGHFPAHRIYCEPFGGAASVLLRKEPAYAEVWNDIDDDLGNLFEVLRDPFQAARLIELVALTPYSRREFLASYAESADPVEKARRLIARSFMGHGATAANRERSTGFRCDTRRSYSTPSHNWSKYPRAVAAVAERFQSGVVVEQRPALEVIARFDSRETLFYIDPPYPHEARSPKRVRGELSSSYRHELTGGGHAELLAMLRQCQAAVVVSGYPSEIYDRALAGWRRVERGAWADGGNARTEVLWLNPRCVAGLAGAL